MANSRTRLLSLLSLYLTTSIGGDGTAEKFETSLPGLNAHHDRRGRGVAGSQTPASGATLEHQRQRICQDQRQSGGGYVPVNVRLPHCESSGRNRKRMTPWKKDRGMAGCG
jgi:hypothetical protein